MSKSARSIASGLPTIYELGPLSVTVAFDAVLIGEFADSQLVATNFWVNIRLVRRLRR